MLLFRLEPVSTCQAVVVHKGLTQNSAPMPSWYTKRAPPNKLSASTEYQKERFDFASDRQLPELSKGLIPANTSKSTKWAIKTFESWSEARNRSRPQDPIPVDLLACNDPARLCTHLSRFAVETRNANGDPYPPTTIHHAATLWTTQVHEGNQPSLSKFSGQERFSV